MKIGFIPTMPVVCSYCHTLTGWVATTRDRAHWQSHGCCKACARKQISQIKKP